MLKLLDTNLQASKKVLTYKGMIANYVADFSCGRGFYGIQYNSLQSRGWEDSWQLFEHRFLSIKMFVFCNRPFIKNCGEIT